MVVAAQLLPIACWGSGFESRRGHGCFVLHVVSKDKTQDI
jgi:hypothetical protein